MAEPVLLKLGTKEYGLLFDNAAAFAFEAEYRRRFGQQKSLYPHFLIECASAIEIRDGKGFMRPGGPSLSEVLVALWALANTNHVKSRPASTALTIEKLQGEIDVAAYGTYVGLAIEAVNQGLPEPEADEGEKKDSPPLDATSTPGA